MDNFIKKIFDGKEDELVHFQMQKFSKGEFRDKALINVNKVKEKYSIATSYEYASDLVRIFAEMIPKGKKVPVTGVIVSTRDLGNELKFKDKKQFMGIKQYIIEDELTGEEMISLCDKYPTSFLGLSFKVEENELKIKSKAPKSAKPSTSDKAATPDFCKVKTTQKNIVKNLLFDIDDFKKVQINHTFFINDLKIPKDEKDPLKMREKTIRIGKIIRKINIDGKEIIKESKFEA